MVWFTAIKSFIFNKSNTLLYIGIALVIVATGGYIYYQKNKILNQQKEISNLTEINAVLNSKLEDAIQVNKENEKAFSKFKQETNKAFEIMRAQHKKELSRAIEYSKIIEEIRYVKEKDDGIAAPVLVNTFNRLQQLQGGNTKSNNTNQDRKTASTK
jgi:hydroxymethylpyrimidine pyrophosphatase-like HAD family hydrolase